MLPLLPLRKSLFFRRATQRGYKIVAPHFILQVMIPSVLSDESFETGIGVGITASRKVGNAVLRNKAKRRMRVLMKDLSPIEGLQGAAVVMIARSSLVTASFEALKKEAATAYSKAVIFTKQFVLKESS